VSWTDRHLITATRTASRMLGHSFLVGCWFHPACRGSDVRAGNKLRSTEKRTHEDDTTQTPRWAASPEQGSHLDVDCMPRSIGCRLEEGLTARAQEEELCGSSRVSTFLWAIESAYGEAPWTDKSFGMSLRTELMTVSQPEACMQARLGIWAEEPCVL